MTMPAGNLQGISQTLLVPLTCRAIGSTRPNAIIQDPRAVELCQALGGGMHFLMGMSGHDLFASVMRVRQFDNYARAFLGRNPGGLVVDVGRAFSRGRVDLRCALPVHDLAEQPDKLSAERVKCAPALENERPC